MGGTNRAHRRKFKKGSGCKMCKPHKGKWAPFFKPREKSQRLVEIEEALEGE
uniref:Uncharacterized protein n=1 Tax=viral metagenome TaxID=1070528 RepID=A0A6M3IR21_9ZZZZ